MPLMECAAIAAANQPDKIDALATVIKKVKGAKVLNHATDVPLNRVVLAFAGEPAPVSEAAFRLVAKVVELKLPSPLIVPLIPLRDLSIEECVESARNLAQRVHQELSLPVTLYGAAALRPELNRLVEAPHAAPDYGTSG